MCTAARDSLGWVTFLRTVLEKWYGRQVYDGVVEGATHSLPFHFPCPFLSLLSPFPALSCPFPFAFLFVSSCLFPLPDMWCNVRRNPLVLQVLITDDDVYTCAVGRQHDSRVARITRDVGVRPRQRLLRQGHESNPYTGKCFGRHTRHRAGRSP